MKAPRFHPPLLKPKQTAVSRTIRFRYIGINTISVNITIVAFDADLDKTGATFLQQFQHLTKSHAREHTRNSGITSQYQHCPLLDKMKRCTQSFYKND